MDIFLDLHGPATAGHENEPEQHQRDEPCRTAQQSSQEANQFSLQSDTITVSYSSTSIAGVPQFTYRDLAREVSRSGDDIRREDTEIGTLVTIDVEAAPDAPTVSFSLVLPRINLGAGNQQVILQTLGVRTTDFTTAFLPGPILGQGQAYEVFDMRGLAQFVTF